MCGRMERIGLLGVLFRCRCENRVVKSCYVIYLLLKYYDRGSDFAGHWDMNN